MKHSNCKGMEETGKMHAQLRQEMKTQYKNVGTCKVEVILIFNIRREQMLRSEQEHHDIQKHFINKEQK